MRFEKLATLLQTARRLAGSSEGMTLDDIAREAGVDRRTAERMRDTLRDLFPTMEEFRDGRAKRFRIRGGLDGFLQAPTVDELAELEAGIRALEASGGEARASLLRSLGDKIHAALRAAVRQRIGPDLDALLSAEALILQAGPRPLADSETLALLREALKACRLCSFEYTGPATSPQRLRRVRPYGILFGKAYYLVGPEAGRTKPVLWRLDRMSKVELGYTTQGPPPSFRLAEFAAGSFGAFQEDPAEIVLKFSLEAAADARRFLFHPSQTNEELGDGSLVVRFRSGGFLELVRHLFTWRDAVEILAPQRLCELMVAELELALVRHRG
jgi:predicted DNA-binding transcriptional regulator YafY